MSRLCSPCVTGSSNVAFGLPFDCAQGDKGAFCHPERSRREGTTLPLEGKAQCYLLRTKPSAPSPSDTLSSTASQPLCFL